MASKDRKGGIDPATQQQTYDRDARSFRDSSELLSTWIYIGGPEIDAFVKGLPGRGGAKVWDQGSASGRVVRRLIVNGIGPKNIVGVEISPDQVAIARKEIPEAEFIVGDLATVRLGANSFDAATQHMVAEHLDDATLDAVNANTFKALKPGGRYLVILTHPSKTAVSKGSDESGPFMTTFPWGGKGLNYHRTRKELMEAYQRAGFIIDEVTDISMPDKARLTHPDDYKKYLKYPHVRLSLVMHKP